MAVSSATCISPAGAGSASEWAYVTATGTANATPTLYLYLDGAGEVFVERRYARPIMSSFHALFSLGGLVGAGAAGLAIAAGLGALAHVALATTIATATMTMAVSALLTPPPDQARGGPTFAWPSRALLGLGSLAFLGLLDFAQTLAQLRRDEVQS